jgi:hypothetical protein
VAANQTVDYRLLILIPTVFVTVADSMYGRVHDNYFFGFLGLGVGLKQSLAFSVIREFPVRLG